MKYNLEVRYAGQKAIFTDLELDDEATADETYQWGVDENNSQATENFWNNAELTVMRKEDLPPTTKGATKGATEKEKVWRVTAGGFPGATGYPPEKCDMCRKPFFRTAYDAKTRGGPWGWLCPSCFDIYGIGLGVGVGQRYQLVQVQVQAQAKAQAKAQEAILER